MDNTDVNISATELYNENSYIWVFGYGSLCWFPGFDYEKCVTGYIRGYVRRFFQGNITHRGTKEKPGRVANLIKKEKGVVWGCAFKIKGKASLDYLKERECNLGGYETEVTKFFSRLNGDAFPVLFYNASPQNSLWLGEKSLPEISNEIVDCSGKSGHNVEYILRLAEFIHELPDVVDEHLFELEDLITKILIKRKIKLSTIMGANPKPIKRRDSRNTSFEFTSRVPEKNLRCLHI